MAAGQRILFVVLLAWALAMIVPDLWRVVQPLGSFGFYANNDGLIYNVTGPFDDETASPAWNAGIWEGDRLDLSKMRCFPYDAAAWVLSSFFSGGSSLLSWVELSPLT